MSERGVAQLLARQQDWIAAQRHRQVPRLGLERLGVSKSEARIAAREVISALAEEEAPRIGVRYQRLRIGDQRTLWGSCSARGTISFNWRLVLTPPEVLDYVVVHELCHLHVLDHSARFWQRVERYRPQWREQRDWLREHGAELLALDPAD
jgi:predicted metal-dependent hydrolase